MPKPFIIALAGGSGSGKTTIVDLIKKQYATHSVLVFTQDHYYLDLSQLPSHERAQINFDHPKQLDNALMYEDVKALSCGISIQRPNYDFTSHTRSPETTQVDPAAVIILDGIFSLYYEAIRNLCDLKLYVQVSDDLRFIRRMQRDMHERGRSMESIIEQYIRTVRPMHLKYVEPTKSFADHIIDWETNNPQVIHMLCGLLEKALPKI